MKLKYPVDFIGITQYYSNDHQSIDLGWHNTPNEKIYSCESGVVSAIYDDVTFGGGLTLEINYDKGFKSVFKHLSDVLVSVGDNVGMYQHVAYMGSSGWDCGGPHLHLTIYKDGIRVNPVEYLYVYENQEVSEKDKNNVLYYVPEPEPAPTPVQELNIGDKVKIVGTGKATCYGEEPTAYGIGWIRTIKDFYDKRPYPYQVGDETGTTGFYKADAIERVE